MKFTMNAGGKECVCAREMYVSEREKVSVCEKIRVFAVKNWIFGFPCNIEWVWWAFRVCHLQTLFAVARSVHVMNREQDKARISDEVFIISMSA